MSKFLATFICTYVTRFAKTAHLQKFVLLPYHVLKAFFRSNIKSELQKDSQLQVVKARDAVYGFVYIPMALKITHI